MRASRRRSYNHTVHTRDSCHSPLGTMTKDKNVHRWIAAQIVAATVVITSLIAVTAYGASISEFEFSLRSRVGWKTPQISEAYRSVYAWCWVLPIGGLLWGLCVLLKPTQLHIVAYVAWMSTFSVGWLLFTLLAFYLANQNFIQ